jgi:hypothetical protein
MRQPPHAPRKLNMAIADGLLELSAALEKSMQRDLDRIERINELLREIDDLRADSDDLLEAED